MAEKGKFGTKIPHLKDIVKIDGEKLIDADGDWFDLDLIRFNQKMGGNFELLEPDKKAPRKTQKKKSE